MVLGPCNTVTANVVAPNRRAAAYAAFIFFIHLFGDISSPILLGWISELFGEPDVMASPIGRFFASIGANAGGRYQPDRGDALGRADLATRLPLLLDRLVFSFLGTRTRSAAPAGLPPKSWRNSTIDDTP